MPEPDLAAWLVELTGALDVPTDSVDITQILNLARDAARGVARPAAPLTTFVAGLAAGRAGGGKDAVGAALAQASELVNSHADSRKPT